LLIDDIAEMRRNPKAQSNFNELPTNFMADFFDREKPVVFRVDNVCEYMEAKKNEWDWNDFPNVAPAYRSMWMEWQLKNENRQTIGVLISSAECRTTQEAADALRQLKLTVLMKFGLKDTDDVAKSLLEMADVPPEQLKWILHMTTFVRFNMEKLIVFVGNTFLLVKENGESFASPEMNGKGVMSHPSAWIVEMLKGRAEQGHQSAIAYAHSLAGVPCMSLSFLHARGIKEQAAPPIPDALQRARVRRGRLPLFRHHTLVLDVPKRIIRDGNQGNEDLTPQALHLVRGHFKNFNEKPLFGKHKGIWFWHPTVKGNRSAGEITKDYEIRVPKNI